MAGKPSSSPADGIWQAHADFLSAGAGFFAPVPTSRRFTRTNADGWGGRIRAKQHARAALRVSGARAREVLAKGSIVDLHPSVFPVGTTALTSFAHIGVQLWRTEDGPEGVVFEILAARSMAGSFWSWFAASVAEFGCRVKIGGD